jgi:hypothetical protein
MPLLLKVPPTIGTEVPYILHVWTQHPYPSCVCYVPHCQARAGLEKTSRGQVRTITRLRDVFSSTRPSLAMGNVILSCLYQLFQQDFVL